MAIRYGTFIKRYAPVMDDTGESLKQYGFNDPEVTDVAPEQERFIWTMLDCDGKMVIAPQHHRVNRMFYVRTGKPWTDPNVEVIY